MFALRFPESPNKPNPNPIWSVNTTRIQAPLFSLFLLGMWKVSRGGSSANLLATKEEPRFTFEALTLGACRHSAAGSSSQSDLDSPSWLGSSGFPALGHALSAPLLPWHSISRLLCELGHHSAVIRVLPKSPRTPPACSHTAHTHTSPAFS